MRIVGSVKIKRWSIEDYLYTDVIQKSQHTGSGKLVFRYGMSPLPENVTIDVDAFCSEDGVNWNPMNAGQSFTSENTSEGFYGEITIDLVDLDDDFLKFGFNVNGENFEIILFGVVTE